MASPEDYVGQSFGSFEIVKQLGHGAEAEVYVCLNKRSNRAFALRLDVADDGTWDGEPQLPPSNRSIEAKNAIGSWHAKQVYEPSLEDRIRKKRKDKIFGLLKKLSIVSRRSDVMNFKIGVPVVYGVIDQIYLIPVSDPWRLANSLRIDEINAMAQPEDLHLFELWEDIALTLLQDTHSLATNSLSPATWRDRWGKIAHGRIMKNALENYMKGGTLNENLQQKILTLLPDAAELYPEFAKNLTLRLIGAVARGRCTLEVASRTLRCKYFRENLSWLELEQLVSAYQNLVFHRAGGERSIPILRHFFMKISEPVFNLDDDPKEYVLSKTQDTLAQYDLFLQEFVGSNNPLPTLEVSTGV